MDITIDWAERKRFHKNRKKLKRAPQAEPPIDEAKITRLLEEKERNIEREIAAELPDPDIIYIVGAPHPPRPKIDRTIEKELYAALTMSERVEFAFRCKAKAREAWERGNNELKWKWGGW